MGTAERLAAVDLNLLISFDALMSERSVTHAAARIGVRQPAMSATLARLRRLFDDPLFVRERGCLLPTPLAESLARPIAQALDAAQSVVDGRRGFDAARDERAFTVLASDYVSITLLHPLLAGLRAKAPYVSINVRPIEGDFAERVRRRQADLVVLPRQIAGQPPGLESADLFEDRNVCVVDAASDSVGSQVTVEELRSLPLLTYEGGALGSLGATALGRQSLDRDLDVSAQSFVVGAFMLTGTRMVALLPQRLADLLASPARIRVVATPKQLPAFVETMYWSERSSWDPALRWLRDQLVDTALAMEVTPKP